LAAWIVAGFPLVFEYYGMLFPEALAIPLTLAVLLALGHSTEPSWKRAAAIGALIGLLLLVRPNSFFLFAPVLVLWSLTGGLKRGFALTAIAIAAAVVVVAPWTIRNAVVTDGGFIPLSVQDGGAFGTFNEESANDPDNPYAWRFALQDPPAKLEEVLTRMPRPDDAEVRSAMQEVALDYIRDNPSSVVQAFFWNGIVRTWDLRSPDKALDEVQFQGRSETVRAIGLGIYWVLLAFAIAGAWLVRRRRELLWTGLALVLAASISFTIIGGTRYRAPLEPVVAIGAALAIMSIRPLNRTAR
jgi:4-amino-4-deoxy-L-arabinose transferase-like glycosyltransferase